jgi:hypothetical protein
MIGLHVCDVSFAVLGMVDFLVPGIGKLAFPIAMPVGFILPPRIATAATLVSPVPNPDLSALRNYGISTANTRA